MTRIDRLTHAAAAVLVVLALAGAPAGAAPPEQSFVKYYVVRDGGETLYDLAARLLDDRDRYSQIMHLNTGRAQPDGTVLTDPGRLRAGWVLVLPWDAYGEGVTYGIPPASEPRRPDPPEDACARDGSGADPDWAVLRVAANQAWGHSRGEEQVVAVVGSGVDGTLPELTGRVEPGVNAAGTPDRADADCLGPGTAMAAIIAGRAPGAGGFNGVAPDATVLPVRILTTAPDASPEVQAAGVEAAAEADVAVLALSAAVDVTRADVAEAVASAVEGGAVVVVAAPAGPPAGPTLSDGVIRVAGVGADGRTAAEYRHGAVDIAAPGVNVVTPGTDGPVSGGDYAVAYVAGAVALVRAAYPELTVTEVRHRVLDTAEPMTEAGRPDARYGWGMVDPAEAVSRDLPGETGGDPGTPLTAGGRPGGDGSVALVIVVLAGLVAAALLGLRFRRLWQE
ncbi:S8 family serine peptidase [Catenuloplanes indicus]|uniref:Peptidase S8/S53 domain-containing protein n=1 Tax=Catenuloplanes indicus TaxID=137267 RepID=A0AAE3W614_9ACTN|nr:S8 family serine peptidase [Catenuloplanes indicus]MDQ0369935.1 hypothetical protein [Catenuloplanes indicus]